MYVLWRVVRVVALLAVSSLAFSACDLVRDREHYSVDVYIGPPITRESAGSGWSGEFQSSGVVLRYHNPPESRAEGDTIFITLSADWSNPSLEEVWFGDTNRIGKGTTIREARVWLQDWDPQGVVSGQVRYELNGRTGKTAFWVDLSEGIAERTGS